MNTDTSNQLSDNAPETLSLVIPAYQEEKRIGNTIKSLVSYLDNHYPNTQVIVVCDGCSDKTSQVAKESFQSRSCSLAVIELDKNYGKGFAIKTGVAKTTGKYVVYTDADLSFSPRIMSEFLAVMQNGADIAIAQRKKTIGYSSMRRRALAQVSRFLVGNFILPGIRDSQAGYKMFSGPIAKELFQKIKTRRFLFDLEILLMAKKRNYRVEKVYVDWEDKPGSKVRFFADSLRSARDIMVIMFFMLTGHYDRKQS